MHEKNPEETLPTDSLPPWSLVHTGDNIVPGNGDKLSPETATIV